MSKKRPLIQINNPLDSDSAKGAVKTVVTVAVLAGIGYGIYYLAKRMKSNMPPSEGGVPSPHGLTLGFSVLPPNTGVIVPDPQKTTYDYGDVVLLSAQPTGVSTFWYWTLDGEYCDMINPMQILVTGSHEYTAHFN